jgi:class 3 adenylate cyclase/tetratricopeptide (TPR) repeat protein
MAEPRDASAFRSARRRYLTLLYSDLSDSTTLAGSVEPEHYLEVLDHLTGCAQRIIPAHGGTSVDFRGDGVLAMFGFPESSEHDGRRATEAALALHQAVAEMRLDRSVFPMPALTMHSGIHSGLVLLIEGDRMSAGYLLGGEAPNIAARLSDAAGPGEILLSAATLGTESHFFQVRTRGDLALQGKAAAVTACEVLGRSAAATRFEAHAQGGLTPFVGRAEPLAVLERALRQSMRGRLRSISVVGPPGIGKTRLVEEFLLTTAVRSCTVYRGYCDDYGSAGPLQPFLQILRAIATDTAAVSVADAPGSIRDLFSKLATSRALVLFIDDWQWADDASRQVLAAIRELTERAILIVTTSRVPEGHDDDALSESEVRVRLAPLDLVEAADAIRALWPTANPFTVDRVLDRSGRNPLFIEELCHLSEREAAEEGSAVLARLIESRVSRLAPLKADLVRAAAVIGTVIPVWLFEQLTGRTARDPIVEALATEDFLFPEAADTLRFKHGSTREFIYKSIGLDERERTHLRVAELLQQRRLEDGRDDLLDALAYHYRGAAQRLLAAEYAERAGDKALAAAALDRARTHYLGALELIELSDAAYPRWMSIVQRLGLACVFDSSADQLPIFRRAVELAAARNDDAALARAEYWVGYISYALGELNAAIHHCERAREHSVRALAAARQEGATKPAVELEAHAVQVLATLGQARAAAGEPEGVLEQLDEAIAIKRRYRSGRRPAVGLAYTLASKGWVLGERGRFAEADDCFGEAIDVVRGDTQPVRASILAWQAGVHAWQGRWSDAIAAGTEAQQIAERVESLYILAMSQAVGGYARWMEERAPGALDAIVRATSWVESRGKRLFISLSYGWLAEGMLAAGRYDESRTYAERALDRARHRDVLGEALAYRALAALPAEFRQHPPEQYLEAAMRSAQARQSPHEEALTHLRRAQIAAAASRRDETETFAIRACAAFRAMDMSWHQRQAELLTVKHLQRP